MRLPGTKRFIPAPLRTSLIAPFNLVGFAANQLESRRQRGVVGDLGQRIRVVHVRLDDAQPARIDAVEAEHRQHRRKGPRRSAAGRGEDLDHAKLPPEASDPPCCASR